MNVKSLRAIVKLLRKPGARALASPESRLEWHLAGTAPRSPFNRRWLKKEMPSMVGHSFEIRKGPLGGTVATISISGENEAAITRVASTSRDAMGYPVPLELGVGDYRRLFRGMRSALGLGPGTKIRFTRAPNVFNLNPNRRKIRRKTSSVRIR